MAVLGDLERSIMEILWEVNEPLTANEVREQLPTQANGKPLATTTVLTVLGRLEKKNVVGRSGKARPFRFVPTATRAEHTARLMEDALGTSADREAALVSFVGSMSTSDASALARILERRDSQ